MNASLVDWKMLWEYLKFSLCVVLAAGGVSLLAARKWHRGDAAVSLGFAAGVLIQAVPILLMSGWDHFVWKAREYFSFPARGDVWLFWFVPLISALCTSCLAGPPRDRASLWCLAHKKIVIGVAAVIFLAAVYSIGATTDAGWQCPYACLETLGLDERLYAELVHDDEARRFAADRALDTFDPSWDDARVRRWLEALGR